MDEAPQWRRLHPRILPARLVVGLLALPVWLGIAWGLETWVQATLAPEAAPWRGSGYAVLLGLGVLRGFVYPILWYRTWRFALAAGDLRVRRGVLWRHEQAVPLDRVQHVDVHAGPLDRMFGLAGIVVFTAGSGVADVAIPGLAAVEAAELRDRLLRFADVAPAPEAA